MEFYPKETPSELQEIQILLNKAFERGHKPIGICITPELNSKLLTLAPNPHFQIMSLFGFPVKIANMPAVIIKENNSFFS